MSGGISSGRPDMLCGGSGVDPRTEGFRGEKKKVKSPEEQAMNICELFADSIVRNGDVSDLARSFAKKVD